MGNSASNASSSPSRAIRGASPAPSPGVPHPSLRTKKKSLELPDLASLSLDNTRGRQAKTASIPIPTTAPSPFRHYQQCQYPQPQLPPPRAPRHLPSTADVNLVPSYSSVPRPNPAAPRGRQQQQQVARMQELYNQSQQPTHSPSHHRSFQQETVRSSIPVALSKALPNELPPAEEIVQQEYPQKEDLLADFIPVKIVWKGGGTQVMLARAGDEEWKGRQPMEKKSANVWTLTVMLRPGTHHVRFMVDGQWRVADDLPAAVDDQGSLANYVAVPIPVHSSPPLPPATVPREKLLPGQSFWSADSSADGEYQHPSLQQQHQQHQTHSHTTHSGRWTNVLPPELIEAALEEEAYLSASAGHYDVSSSNTRVTTGFIPAPNIPPAPGLPRHLEKLILNTRVGAGLSGVSGIGGAAGAATRSGSGQASGGVGSMRIGSGQGQAARRDRDRERDRERERGERGIRKRATTAAASAAVNIPPPPPPSEDGSVPPSSRVPVPSLPETPLIDTTMVHSAPASSTTTPSSTSAPTISTNASTPPQTSLPSTPIAPMSPIWSNDLGKTYGSENGNGGTEASPTLSPTRSPTALHGSISASTSADASATNSATASPNPSTNPTTPVATPPTSHLSPSASTSHTTPTGSRTITIDSTNMPALSDDGSVLPVPSHVVLHHLSTSAIRNGVLAVGNTTRYRKKYLTTIYYKPT